MRRSEADLLDSTIVMPLWWRDVSPVSVQISPRVLLSSCCDLARWDWVVFSMFDKDDKMGKSGHCDADALDFGRQRTRGKCDLKPLKQDKTRQNPHTQTVYCIVWITVESNPSVGER